jgi:hypothetical protein
VDILKTNYNQLNIRISYEAMCQVTKSSEVREISAHQFAEACLLNLIFDLLP